MHIAHSNWTQMNTSILYIINIDHEATEIESASLFEISSVFLHSCILLGAAAPAVVAFFFEFTAMPMIVTSICIIEFYTINLPNQHDNSIK